MNYNSKIGYNTYTLKLFIIMTDIKIIDFKKNEQKYAEQKVLDIEDLFGINITIHDPKGILRNSKDVPIFDHRSSHQHPYCVIGRYEKSSYDYQCLQHCQIKLGREVLKTNIPFTSLCWKGVREIVFPVYKNEIHFFTLFGGAFKDAETDFPNEQIHITRKVKNLHHELENFSDKKSEEISRALESLGIFLIDYIEDTKYKTDNINRKQFIKNFFLYHSHENIKLEDLAKVLFLSSSRTSHLIKELYQKSFQELLIEERINRAKVLLISSRRTIAQIALNIGIKNEFYLGRLFKKKVGISPGNYRKKLKNKATQ
ncbi:MAG: hypothetical protein COA79_10500 [Planctomycetota bacterium]|nr:MAG: hypothetical protein COA79_10500 [Planctomycetota bacterium]